MGNKTCTCNPKSVVPSKHFYAKGKVDIFMVISLSDYLTPETRENLGRVRGGRGFAEAIRNLEPAKFLSRTAMRKKSWIVATISRSFVAT